MFQYTGLTDNIGNSLQDFYAATEALENSYCSGGISLSVLLGRMAGLFHDKTVRDLSDADIPHKIKCITDKLLELADGPELARHAETWFVVEIVSYRLKHLADPEPFYSFVAEYSYLAPSDAENSFNAILKTGKPIPGKMLRLLCSHMIHNGGWRLSLDDFEKVLALSRED